MCERGRIGHEGVIAGQVGKKGGDTGIVTGVRGMC